MTSYLENVIEKLIRDGIVTETELQQRIEEEKKKSPVNDLNNIANVEAIQMMLIDNLGMMLGDVMMKVNELEGKIND